MSHKKYLARRSQWSFNWKRYVFRENQSYIYFSQKNNLGIFFFSINSTCIFQLPKFIFSYFSYFRFILFYSYVDLFVYFMAFGYNSSYVYFFLFFSKMTYPIFLVLAAKFFWLVWWRTSAFYLRSILPQVIYLRQTSITWSQVRGSILWIMFLKSQAIRKSIQEKNRYSSSAPEHF